MKFKFTAYPADSYLYYEVSERYNYDQGVEIFRSIKTECQGQGYGKALLDLRQVIGDIPVLDRYKLGDQAATLWGSDIQVAVLAPAAIVTRFFENVAVNRQGLVRVFTDLESARAWLKIS